MFKSPVHPPRQPLKEVDRYSCISARYKTLSFLASIMPLFPGFPLSLDCSFLFLQLSFSLLFTNFGAYQGSLLGTLRYCTQNLKDLIHAQVFYISYIQSPQYIFTSSLDIKMSKTEPLSVFLQSYSNLSLFELRGLRSIKYIVFVSEIFIN